VNAFANIADGTQFGIPIFGDDVADLLSACFAVFDRSVIFHRRSLNLFSNLISERARLEIDFFIETNIAAQCELMLVKQKNMKAFLKKIQKSFKVI
jgi:hypothetical protein